MTAVDLAMDAFLALCLIGGSISFGYFFLRLGWSKIRILDRAYKIGWSVVLGVIFSIVVVVIAFVFGLLQISLFGFRGFLFLGAVVTLPIAAAVLTIRRKFFARKMVTVSIPKKVVGAGIASKKTIQKFEEKGLIKVAKLDKEKIEAMKKRLAEKKKKGEEKMEAIEKEKAGEKAGEEKGVAKPIKKPKWEVVEEKRATKPIKKPEEKPEIEWGEEAKAGEKVKEAPKPEGEKVEEEKPTKIESLRDLLKKKEKEIKLIKEKKGLGKEKEKPNEKAVEKKPEIEWGKTMEKAEEPPKKEEKLAVGLTEKEREEKKRKALEELRKKLKEGE